jgi:hypothetical protein
MFNCWMTTALFPEPGFETPPPITGTSGLPAVSTYCAVTQPFLDPCRIDDLPQFPPGLANDLLLYSQG